MRQKTFKIGEYALGGIVFVEFKKGYVRITAKDWNTKQEVASKDFFFNSSVYSDILMWLECEITTYYYADKITNWIKS